MNKNILKLVLFTVVLSSTFYLLWVNGGNWVYAHLLKYGVNTLLLPAKEIYAELAEAAGGSPEFRLVVDGRKGRFAVEAVILPFVILVGWQAALAIVADTKRALKTGGINIGAFYFFQVLFLLTFINQGTSEVLNVLKESLVHSFGIFAVFFILKDIIWFGFHKQDYSVNTSAKSI